MVWGAACVKVQEIQANLILIHPPSAHPKSLSLIFFTHTTFSSTFPPFNQWKSHFICFFPVLVLCCAKTFSMPPPFSPLHRSFHAVALVLAMKRENSMCHTTQWRSQWQQQKKSQKFIDFPPLSLSCRRQTLFWISFIFCVFRCCLFSAASSNWSVILVSPHQTAFSWLWWLFTWIKIRALMSLFHPVEEEKVSNLTTHTIDMDDDIRVPGGRDTKLSSEIGSIILLV